MFSKTKKQHKENLKVLFQTLWEKKLFAKPSKCQFYQKSLTFLGHIVSGEGINPDPEKLAAITNLNWPTNITSLQLFLGIVAFMRNLY